MQLLFLRADIIEYDQIVLLIIQTDENRNI